MNLISETPIRRLLALGGVVLAGGVALSGCSLIADASDDETSGTEVSSEQYDAVADAKAGDCLPEEMLVEDSSTFAVDCSDPTAFWTLTAIEPGAGLTAEADGSLADPTPIYDLCGESVAAQVPGATWSDWNLVYDKVTLEVNYLFCVEAIGNPSALGTTPTVPDAGECFNSQAAEFQYGVLACDSPDVDTTVVDVVEVDPAEWATAEADAESIAMDGCEGDWTYYSAAVDQFGRTAAIYCTN